MPRTTEINTAIILAGGFGTRLQKVVSDVPKPMAPIRNKPFLHYLLTSLQTQGVDKIVFSTGYLHEKIESYFGNNYNGLKIFYSQETKPLGTGGGIKKAFEYVNENAFVVNGDSFFNVDLQAMRKFHTAQKADFTLALKPMQNVERYGTVELKENRITAFREKTFCESGFINGGVYITSRKVFEQTNLPEVFSLETDFLAKQLGNLLVAGFVSDGYFIDIGIPADYHRAEQELGLY